MDFVMHDQGSLASRVQPYTSAVCQVLSTEGYADPVWFYAGHVF